jgi:hypothetical protein
MNKSKYLALVIVLVAGLALTACSDTATPTSSSGTTAPVTTTGSQPTTAAASTAAITTAQSTTAAVATATPATASGTVAANSVLTDPNAGSWKTWLLTSGNQFRSPNPPDQAASQTEISQLKDMVGQRDAAALALINFWNTGGPSYRWNEFMINYSLKNNLIGNVASRDLSLLHTALYDGMVATWDTKFAFNRPRPSQFDPSLTTAIPNPASPAYPSEYAVAAAIGSAILGYVFPNDADFFTKQADDATRSRLLAGVDYPSDIAAGLELGRSIANLAIARGKTDGSDAKWTGSVPTEPGKWNGTNPVFPQGANLKPWVLSSPSEFRPGPPPAYDSAQEKAELQQLKDMAAKRTPKINADAFFWEYGAGGVRGYAYFNDQTSKKILENNLAASPVREARVYALQSIAFYDAAIACWDAKYTYWAPRPFMVDPTFKPLFTTPNHPSYPSAHGCVDTSVTATLGYLFPQDATTFKTLAQEASQSRMWAGLHFQSDVTAGIILGQNVSQKLIDRAKSDGSQQS